MMGGRGGGFGNVVLLLGFLGFFSIHSAGRFGLKGSAFLGFPSQKEDGVLWVDIKTAFTSPFNCQNVIIWNFSLARNG